MRMLYNKSMATYKLIKVIGNPKSKLYSDGFYPFKADSKNDDEMVELTAELNKFHKTNYVGSLMTMTVISNLDKDWLKAHIQKEF